MGGQGSDMFEYFKILILQGLVAARKHSDKIITLVDVMRAGKKSHFHNFCNKLFDESEFFVELVSIFSVPQTKF